MIPQAPQRSIRRGILPGLVILCIATPIFLACLTNLWLASSHGSAWISHQLEQRIGLKTHIAKASLWPWSGITIHHLEIHPPSPLDESTHEPLIDVVKVNAIFNWRACLQKKLQLKSLSLESPRVVLPIEILAALSQSSQQTHPAAPAAAPTLSANSPSTQILPPRPAPNPPASSAQPSASPSSSPLASASPAPANSPPASPLSSPPASPLSDPSVPTNSAPQASISTPPAPPRSTPPPPRQPKITPSDFSKNFWIHLRNGSFKLCSSSTHASLIEISKIHGSIPIAGSAVKATVDIGSITSNDFPLVESLTIPLQWQPPHLTLGPLETAILGQNIQFAAKMAPQDDLPLELQLIVPPQALAPITLPFHSSAKANAIAAKVHLMGFLRASATWQGELIAQTRDATIQLAEQNAEFHFGQIITVLRGHRITCLDARLTGDDASILGNASALADGRFAAVMRLVTQPDNATAITRRFLPMFAKPPSLTPLSTPERVAIDFQVHGNLTEAFLTLGQGGPTLKIQR